jgi:hypothetical protein
VATPINKDTATYTRADVHLAGEVPPLDSDLVIAGSFGGNNCLFWGGGDVLNQSGQ